MAVGGTSSPLALYNISSSGVPLYPSLYHRTGVINPRVRGTHLYQKRNGEIVLIPKSPAEVVGEQVLRPLIDAVIQVGRISGTSYFRLLS